MKGKFRILGRAGLGLLLVCTLMLSLIPALPAIAAEGATAVTEVWVEFPFTSAKNTTSSTANEYYIHFTPTTALSRGVDYVTVQFPDGATAMGPAAFSTISAVAATDLEFSTDYGTKAVSAATWKRSTAAGTCGGYRVKTLVPIDIAAGTGAWLRITSDGITAAATEGSSYKVYVSTTKDTTPVLSGKFALGDSTTASLVTSVSPATAGAAAQYSFTYTSTAGLTGDTDTVTIMFPVGTTLPSSISASNVQFSSDNSTYTASSSTPTVDTDKRTVTATTSTSITASKSCAVKITSAAGITSPTIASTNDYYCMVRDSQDGKWLKGSAHTISAGTITKVMVCNGEVGLAGTDRYSDDATMVNMLSSYIYVTMADQYGNAKAPASNVTVTPSSSSSSGTFYKNANATPGNDAYSTITSITVSAQDPNTAAQQVFYMDTAGGTYTLTFTDSGGTYTAATWTFTVASKVSLYDSSDNLIKSYGATTTAPVAEIAQTASGSTTLDNQKYGVDYINDAITAAMAGDTVKLGDGTYELDATISLNKKVTLTSVNGASSTTLRNIATTFDKGITVGISGTSTNPVIIDGLTFQRLRSGITFERAVYNDGYDYLTVRNCIFNYIEPDVEFDASVSGGVIVIGNNDVAGAITSATVSTNTFNNCCTTWPDLGSGAKAAAIGIIARYQYDTSSHTGYPVTGVTISGNTLTNCGGIGIDFNGYAGPAEYTTLTYVTGSITNNTITNGYSCIQVERNSTSVSVTGNTITGAYSYGVKLCGTTTTAMTIKNNTITNTVGDSNGAGIRIQTVSAVVPAVQYNDITGSNTYAIKADSVAATNCKYNYFGDASGPYYSALTGASVTKSNPNGTGDKITDYVTYYPWLHKSMTDMVNDNASYQSSTMKLVAGWNTLSTPVKLIATADSIDELIPSGMTIGYYYDGGWQQITTGYTLSACDAIYVKMSAATYVQFKFDAGAWTMPSKDLAVGWNLVGLAYLSSSGMDADEAAASVYKTAANLPGYSQVIGPSLIDVQTDLYGSTSCASFAYSSGETSADANMMYAGLGYWVYMQNAATLAGFTITPIAPDLD